MDGLIKFLASILLVLFAGFIGSMFTIGQIDTWYSTIQKPFFNPPNYIFGPVWTVLYILIGSAFYLVWNSKAKNKIKSNAIKLFGLQLILNVAWSIFFFGFENPSLALIGIIVLWVAIIATMRAFLPISKNAVYLMVPYIVWVSFAAVLNLAVVLLN